MNASRLLLAGLLLGTSASLGACTIIPVPVPVPNPRAFIPSAFLPPEAYVVTEETAKQRAQECAGTQGDYAPGIMTYDSKTGVETHQDAYRDRADVSVYNHGTNQATGVSLQAGQAPRRSDICVANGADVHRVDRLTAHEADKLRSDYRQDEKDSKSKKGGGSDGSGDSSDH